MGKVFSLTAGFLWIALIIVLALFVLGLVFYFSPIRDIISGDSGGQEETSDSGAQGFLDRLGNIFGGGGDGNTGEGGGGGSSGASTSGQSAGGESGQAGRVCRAQQISYSLKNFETNSVCNIYSGEDCINKTVLCSLSVTNLDSQTSGIFLLRFEFYDEEENLVGSARDSHFLEAGASEFFAGSVQFIGGDANKSIGCTFDTEEIPRKEVCA